MSNYTIDIENHLNKLGKDVKNFIERLVPLETGDTDFLPDSDIIESDSGYKIVTDLPGMKKEQIHITLKERVLTISGERELTLDKDEVLKRKERKQGVFSRAFAIPVEAGSSDVKASFKNGVLTVTIPKSENSEKAHSITIE
ncbi:MAG: Hsp20/alpha crystallin family protein [Balneolaceae bacterium]